MIATGINISRLFAATARPAQVVQVGAPIADKKSAWDGIYTEDQAKRGRGKYLEACGYCHRDDLSGNGSDEPGVSPPPLAGPPFLDRWRSSTVAELFNSVASTMPKDRPKLNTQAYIDIVSFILQVNGARAGTSELMPEYDTLKGIVITEKHIG